MNNFEYPETPYTPEVASLENEKNSVNIKQCVMQQLQAQGRRAIPGMADAHAPFLVALLHTKGRPHIEYGQAVAAEAAA